MNLATYIAVKDAEVKINATLTRDGRRKLLAELPRELLPELLGQFVKYGPAFPIGGEMVKAITSIIG